MSTISKTLTTEEIEQIGKNDDFHISVLHEDGETYGTLTWIWSVEVEGNLYVRAYNGVNSRWYKSALKQKQGKIKAAGMERKVRFEPVDGPLNEKIDQAYRDKYSSSPYLGSMISDRAKAATMNVFGLN
ncbi:hypothetical protein SAMN05216294_3157 [Flagellimonas zhangzhouensis]|uniref:DUF2255 family protein n=2 Tax=Flagellimonas zhangzhouensis TaxID=1073328 RepID=A0A1H2YLS8_9FLAO|nr:hypothetical protein SAMN05216294_3157 [Allomuricauda zhangzhouensis]SDX06117.1 hypothetical protein SAMN04487892_3107 [Allomuricauda zhangzhouensis]